MSEDIGGKSYFEIFSLPESFQVDREQLQSAYQTLQARYHPDRFAAADDRQRRVALQYTSIINDAYSTLSSPLRRAAYLLTLQKIDPEEHNQAHLGNEFLLTQMQLREQLEAIAESENLDELDALKSSVGAEISRFLKIIDGHFQSREYSEAKPVYNKLQFLFKLDSEINQIEEKLLDY